MQISCVKCKFPLDEPSGRIAPFARMEASKCLSPTATELIDWLAGENLLDLEWDFPEDGDLAAAGLDSEVIAQMVIAVEEEYGVELKKADLTPQNLATPLSLAKTISKLRGKK